jgi:alpha-tubulin suppressor-like RCC1 family protein
MNHHLLRRLLLVGALLAALAVHAPAPAAGQAEAALGRVTSITVGDDHACALLSTGQVRCWGDNTSGQLGNDALGVDAPVPVPVRNVANTGNLTGVTQIAAGTDHTCARLNTGRAVCWGEGGASQLGDGGGLDRDTPVVVRNAANTADLTGVTQVTGGGEHSCARLSNAQVRCWGDNSLGEIGNGDAPNDAFTARAVRNATDTANLGGVATVEAGPTHTCARLGSGQVRCWGQSAQGRLGNNQTTPNRDLPVTVRGTNASGALTGVTDLDVGFDHTCARRSNARVVCWGDNTLGELGDGSNDVALVPRVVSNPTDTGPLTGVSRVGAGGNTTCVALASGQARCWGNGSSGELGDGVGNSSDLPIVVRNPADTGPLRNVVQVESSTDDFTCARLANQQVRCFGENDSGQIGNDDLGNDALLPAVVFLS